MERKRNRLEIIRDILLVIKDKHGKIKPTRILYKSNLSHVMMNEYLQELLEKGFIKEEKTKNSKTYSLTEKGLRYIDEYKMIINFLDSFGLN